ncbi:MAG: leucine-rich repeat protein [Kiritimatiellae bacterium]|nr:leucine-rich repeat protein [Kiritimatiellia bacterium]
MKRFALEIGVLLAVLSAAAPASAMPLGLRTTMWSIAAAQRGGGGDLPPEPPAPDTFAVTFDANGGDGTMAPQTFTNGVVQALSSNEFAKTDFAFAGWATNAAGPVVYSDGQGIAITTDVTLYAQWTDAGVTPPYGTPIFTIEDGVLTAVDLNGATYVEIPDSVTNVAGRVFYECYELRKVTIPACVTYIGVNAFGNCSSLKEVIFEEGSAGLNLVYPFGGTALTDLNLPARWNSRSNGNPFKYCAALTNVTITTGNTTFAIVNGLLLSADGKTVYGALGGVSEIAIPESVETIEYRSLWGLPHVEEILFPENVSNLSGQCVYGCDALKSISIEGTVEMTLWDGNPLFADCPNLKSVYFYGNAPTGNGIQYIYQSTPDDMVTYVTRDSTGWGVDIPGMWNGRRIEYVEQAPPEPEPWDPATIRIDTEAEYKTDDDGTFELDLVGLIRSAAVPTVTVKGLPTGLKYDAKKGVIGGKARKPGVYAVTVSAKSKIVTKPVTATFEIVVPNFTSETLPGLEPDKDAYGVIMSGVALPMDLIDCTPEDGWTVKVAGLPTGLKFTAKDIMKKGSKTDVEVPANTIYGVPTKAGTFTVTFTASKKGEKNHTATITMKVEALPTWAQGTFTGYVVGDGWSHGLATMTVAANGKVSGKIALDGANWSFSAANYAAFDGVDCFEVFAEAKSGKVTKPVWLVLRNSDQGPGTLLNSVAEGTFGGGTVKLWRGIWKDKATATEAKATIAGFEGVYTAALLPVVGGDYGSGYLSLTVGKTGDVKASGKLADGTSVSATSPLMYDEDAGWFVLLYAAPSAYKGGSFAAAVGFASAVSGMPHYRLAPVMFAPQWSSRNVQATGEYGDGFERSAELSGAYYNKLDTLRKYYETVRLGLDGSPELGFTFKETALNGLGKKVTTSSASVASAVDTLDQTGLTATVNGKGAIVVVKATKPVQDKVTKEWLYEGANDGALALSFTKATGIFKGSYTFWYDYVSAYDAIKDKETWTHTSKKVSLAGILVQGEEPTMDGFYLWDATGEYEDQKTGKLKTYKYKQSFPVRLVAE